MASKLGWQCIVHVEAGVNWTVHCNNCCLQVHCRPFCPYDQPFDNCSGG